MSTFLHESAPALEASATSVASATRMASACRFLVCVIHGCPLFMSRWTDRRLLIPENCIFSEFLRNFTTFISFMIYWASGSCCLPTPRLPQLGWVTLQHEAHCHPRLRLGSIPGTFLSGGILVPGAFWLGNASWLSCTTFTKTARCLGSKSFVMNDLLGEDAAPAA